MLYLSKPISTPEIPRKASEPNTYSGVKVGAHEKKRLSDLFKKDKRKSEGEIASTVTLSVNNISYTKRAKSGSQKARKNLLKIKALEFLDLCTKQAHISGLILQC